MTKTIIVKPTETAPTEIIADAIVGLAEAVRKLRSGRLNDKAIIVLLSNQSGMGQREIKHLLDHIEYLPHAFLKGPRK